jgi:hypothetical protein
MVAGGISVAEKKIKRGKGRPVGEDKEHLSARVPRALAERVWAESKSTHIQISGIIQIGLEMYFAKKDAKQVDL